jgi:hypothetical protein
MKQMPLRSFCFCFFFSTVAIATVTATAATATANTATSNCQQSAKLKTRHHFSIVLEVISGMENGGDGHTAGGGTGVSPVCLCADQSSNWRLVMYWFHSNILPTANPCFSHWVKRQHCQYKYIQVKD